MASAGQPCAGSLGFLTARSRLAAQHSGIPQLVFSKGREYVATYVDLMHNVEGLLAAADPAAHAHGAEHSH